MALLMVPEKYKRMARQMLSSAPDRSDDVRSNPVTGARFLSGIDPVGPQIQSAARALMARDQFRGMAPADVQPLSLSYDEREARKVGGPLHIEAWYSRSLHAANYDFAAHPQFEPYARGVLASPCAPEFMTQDASLQERFPPRPLKGLGSGLYWECQPASIRRAPRRQQRLFLNGAPPPLCTNTPVTRHDANVPDSFTPNSQAFLQLDDEFVSHATKLEPCKRLPQGWQVHKLNEVFFRDVDVHLLCVVASDYGWLIERRAWTGITEVLAHLVWDLPVLCDTYASAARLAEAAHKGLHSSYLLKWLSTS